MHVLAAIQLAQNLLLGLKIGDNFSILNTDTAFNHRQSIFSERVRVKGKRLPAGCLKIPKSILQVLTIVYCKTNCSLSLFFSALIALKLRQKLHHPEKRKILEGNRYGCTPVGSRGDVLVQCWRGVGAVMRALVFH